jgi:polysaccharide biosynthesis protein PslE
LATSNFHRAELIGSGSKLVNSGKELSRPMEFTIRDLLSTVFRHARGLLLFWVFLLVAVLIFYTQTRKLYESNAKLLVSLGSEVQGSAEYLNENNLMLTQREQQIHDEQQILQSHQVLLTSAKWILGESTPGFTEPTRDWRIEEARRYLTGEEPEPTLLLKGIHNVMWLLGKLSTPKTHDEQLEDRVRELSKDLKVKLIFDSDALDVTFRYRDPRVAQTILTLIITSYLDHHIEIFQSPAEATLLKTQYDQSIEHYHDRLAQFSAYMTSHGVYSDDSQMATLIEQGERLSQGLNQALADVSSDRAKLNSLSGIDQSLQKYERYSSVEVRNKQRDDLVSKLNDATVEQKALLSRHPEGSRAYQEEETKLAEIRRLVGQEPATVTDQTEQRRTKASELVQSEIISSTAAEHGDLARVNQLRRDLRQNEANLKGYAAGLKGFNSLKLDLDLAKQESEQMAKAYVESHLKNLTSQKSITNVSLIDEPTWDWRAASPEKGTVAAVAGALLLLGSVAFLIASAALDETVTNPRTVKMRLGSEVVGNFPVLRDQCDELEFADRFERDYRGEFARISRAIPNCGLQGRVIVFAESNSGEGASLIAYGLAQYLSNHAREKTAFIDRTVRPLSCEGATCSADDRLTVFGWSMASSDALALFTHALNENINIVIASGAVKSATDLLAIGGIAPTTFLIVESGKTRRAAARFSIDTLERHGFRNVRVVLNKRKMYIPNWMMRFV